MHAADGHSHWGCTQQLGPATVRPCFLTAVVDMGPGHGPVGREVGCSSRRPLSLPHDKCRWRIFHRRLGQRAMETLVPEGERHAAWTAA